MKKAAVFSSKGIGDGLLFLVICENLKKNGYEVILYHNILPKLSQWFGSLQIQPYPNREDLFEKLESFDLIVVNSDSQPIIVELKNYLKNCFTKKFLILHLSTCKGKNLPGDYSFNRKMTVIDNLTNACKTALHLQNVSKNIKIYPQPNLVHRKYLRRIIIHATSREIAKNWPAKRFIKIAKFLKSKNLEVVFVMSEEEHIIWNSQNKGDDIVIKTFGNLNELASYFYESGYFLGNDSGMGHLASLLKIPTLTIFNIRRKLAFWRPDFSKGISIAPWPLLLNIKGLRLRDKYWQLLIPTWRVRRHFKKLYKED
jgi:heptosyltransferase III